MHYPRTASLAAWFAVLALITLQPVFTQDALRAVVDSAGRRLEIPQRISRVLAAGPPASILPYTLAPERMIGWVRTPSPAEKALFLLESVRELPEYGRLTGRAARANLEVVLRFKPDLIIDSGSVAPTYVSLANNVQEQTKIPQLLLDGRLESTPAVYRLLGVNDRAERLARYADETLNGLKARIGSIPESERSWV
jgi:iron complex transport system substrate-binding protein